MDQIKTSVSITTLHESHPPRVYCDSAYYLYRSIDPNKPETRNAGIKFKKAFCRQGVRIHFVGVWYAEYLYYALCSSLS